MSRGGTRGAAGAPGNPLGGKAAARVARAAAARTERQRKARIARLRRLAIVLGVAVVVLALVLVIVARRESGTGSASTATPTGLTTYQGSFLDVNSANQYSSRAANAYYCAPQGQRKALHTARHAKFPAEGSGGPSDADLVAEAKAVGIDSAAYPACVSSHRFTHFATVTQIDRLAALTKIRTPTMLVNGRLFSNAQTLTPGQLDALVAQVSS